jgi:hypothetical protein
MQSDERGTLLAPLATDEDTIRTLDEAGYRSIFDIVRQPEGIFCAQLVALEPEHARNLHARASKRAASLTSLYRAYQSRSEPVMQQIPKLGINRLPTELAVAVERSLGGAPDFDDLFLERSSSGYAEAASIQSLFSPGRYLTELYKIAAGLHPAANPLNIDLRRPDIAALVLDEANLDKAVSTLDILVEILEQRLPPVTNLASLATIYYPMTLPYHDDLVQIRNVFAAADLSLQQVWDALDDIQALEFAPTMYARPTALLSATTPSPRTREQLQLTPATYDLLATATPATAASIQNHYGLATADIALELKPVAVFTEHTGLTFNQLIAMTAQADYLAGTPSGRTVGQFWRYGASAASAVTEYGQTYLSSHSAPRPLLVGQGAGGALELQLDAANAVPLADRAERLVRLQQQVKLEFHQLDWLIKNASVLHRLSGVWISSPVLDTVAEFTRLSATYGLSTDAFCCFIGDMNIHALQFEQSLYERLFTSPTDGTTVPLNATLNFTPSALSAYTSIICGALQVSADELYAMAQLAFATSTPTAVAMTSAKYAQLYRMAMIPRMFGLSFTQAEVLWGMMFPGERTAGIVGGAPNEQTLEIIRSTETVLAWMDDHQLDMSAAFNLTTSAYNSHVTPELFNFTHNIHTALSSDAAARAHQQGGQLMPPLEQKLHQLIAPVFRSKPNVMGRLLQWQDKHFQNGGASYGLGEYWADIDTVFSVPAQSNLSPAPEAANVARYSQAMAQYALIAQWADLTEQEVNLIDSPGWFIRGVSEAPPPSLELLLHVARLKQWLERVVVPKAEALGYFQIANESGQTAERAIEVLAYIQGWDVNTAKAMNARLSAQLFYSGFPRAFNEVFRLEAWMQAGIQLNADSVGIGQLHEMSKHNAAAEASALLRAVTALLTGADQPRAQTAAPLIQVARRDALVAYTIAHGVPAALAANVTTAEDLYEYLLIDTRIGPEVATTWIAESISSVQLYINRCLGGYEPGVDNGASATMVVQSRPGGFLYDWPDYNQVYGTWAGKERLQYYPSVYLDPSLRYNKTELFNALEETINQGRISERRVATGFQEYLQGFEALAKLDTISGYQAGVEATAGCEETLYFIGRTPNTPHTYYWRSCNMAVRNDVGNVSGGAWSQWRKVNAPAAEALDQQVKPCWFHSRLHVGWISRTENGATSNGSTTAPTYQYRINIWSLQPDGSWVSERNESLQQRPQNFALVNNVAQDRLDVLLDNTGAWGDDVIVYCDTGVPLTPPDNKAKPGDTYFFKSPWCDFQVAELTNDKLVLITIVVVRSEAFVSFYNYAGSQTREPMRLHTTADGEKVIFEVGIKGLKYLEVWQPDDKIHRCNVYSDYSQNATPAHFHISAGWLTLDSQNLLYMRTDAAVPFATTLQQSGIDGLLSYATQTAHIEHGKTAAIDFNGAYGLYFWEIFFHASFLIADRYLIEQNYAESELWYRYIFSTTGYRDAQGMLALIGNEPRYWNVVPLQQDHTWNTAIPPTVDPDVIAMNDPMHYKMAIFINSVNTLIERGDSCYRMLQRDLLAQAKMYYLQAAQMLGARPEIAYNNSWPNPTVSEEAEHIALLEADDPDAPAPTVLSTLLRGFLDEQYGNFLPPYNVDLLVYWDKLEVRFYNLRNGLSLDGQPLSLPVYATPASPQDLQRQHGAGNGPGGSSAATPAFATQFRFTALLDKARLAVGSVIQFGNALQGALLQRDNEYMSLLVQTQQQQVTALTQELQSDNIGSLAAAVSASQEALNGAKSRLAHYTGLYNNWISSSEQSAMDLRVAAASLNIASQPLNSVAEGMEVVPNIFGLACGGTKYGGIPRAVAIGLQMSAMVLETSAQRLDISEQYRRRRQDWQVQRDNAASEVAQLNAQIVSQQQQLTMAQKQQALSATELANLQAQYTLQTTRFTGLELFNWMSGRLASVYYQFYDAALALCLTAKVALEREIGNAQTANVFTAPMWNDLYQGLVAGEGLQLELQKLENTYLRLDQRGLEILKTVSLNTQITKANSGTSFPALVTAALAGQPAPLTGGVQVAMSGSDKLVITLAIGTLGLNSSYGSSGKVGRFKNISVTLPALLGPYQDVEATLTHNAGTSVALSRGLDDSGVFVLDFNDPKYLPFEGDPTGAGTLSLTFFKAGASQDQRELVESLVDVIFQLRYTLKGN